MMNNDWHATEIRVRYCETDAMGYLHHGNYANYFEIARTELFRNQGGDYRAMEERGLFFVVVSLEIQFKRPARYDDLLSIACRVERMTGAKLMHEYRVTRGDELIALGRTVLACVDQRGAIQRLNQQLLYGSDERPSNSR